MSKPDLRVALVQMNSQESKTHNLHRATELIQEAAATGAKFVALPEYVDYLGPKETIPEISEPIPGSLSRMYSALAREHGIYLHCGSFHEQSEIPGIVYNTSLLIDPTGQIISKYRKIHLFDIDITGNVTANESAGVRPGNEIVAGNIGNHRVGLSICYDLRFPELYRQLALDGAEILLVPAAFTMFTGKDHWITLLQARAIENQAFVLAPAQWGKHPPNSDCYGHSVIIDPWGTILSQAPDGEGVIAADLRFTSLERIRRELPSLSNRRPEAYSGIEQPAV